MMDQTEIGTFIAKCRKEKNLTQAQLAEQLNITDRAVSKWETGKSMPDPSIMLALCEILGITGNELLSGKAADRECSGTAPDKNLTSLKKSGENSRANNGIISIIFSAVLFAGIIVCLICNIAISGSVTWSPIPVSSIAFAWVIFFPSVLLGKRGIIPSCISLSVFMIPYLLLLSRFLKVNGLISIGVPVAMASILFLWGVVAVFQRMGKQGKWVALGIVFLFAVPFMLIINVILSKAIATPILDGWDMLSVLLLLLLAAASFIYGHVKKKGAAKQ